MIRENKNHLVVRKYKKNCEYHNFIINNTSYIVVVNKVSKLIKNEVDLKPVFLLRKGFSAKNGIKTIPNHKINSYCIGENPVTLIKKSGLHVNNNYRVENHQIIDKKGNIQTIKSFKNLPLSKLRSYLKSQNIGLNRIV